MFISAIRTASTPYRLFALAAAISVACAASGFAGWTAQGWRKDAAIASLKEERSADVAKQSQDALTDLTEAAKRIKGSAARASVDVSALGRKLDSLNQGFNNAKPPALPADCSLDAVRLRGITEAAAAVNEAIARRKSGATVQGNSSPAND